MCPTGHFALLGEIQLLFRLFRTNCGPFLIDSRRTPLQVNPISIFWTQSLKIEYFSSKKYMSCISTCVDSCFSIPPKVHPLDLTWTPSVQQSGLLGPGGAWKWRYVLHGERKTVQFQVWPWLYDGRIPQKNLHGPQSWMETIQARSLQGRRFARNGAD